MLSRIEPLEYIVREKDRGHAAAPNLAFPVFRIE